MVKVLTLNQALIAENERLAKLVGPIGSIWRLRKEELIEIAIAEPGVTRTQASKETVLALRERIRRSREESVAQSYPPQTVLDKHVDIQCGGDLSTSPERRALVNCMVEMRLRSVIVEAQWSMEVDSRSCARVSS